MDAGRLTTWLRRQPEWVADGLLALLVVGAQLWLVWPADPRPAALALGLAATAPIAWRRRWPVGVLLAVGASSVALAALRVPLHGFGPMVALYTVAWLAPRRQSLASLVVFAGLSATSLVLAGTVEVAPTSALVIVVAWVLGDRRRLEAQRAGLLQRRAEDLERERADRSRLATARRRARVVGELHDALARNLASMVARVREAEQLASTEPATTALAQVERTGRECLGELRRLGGLLRSELPGGGVAASAGAAAAAGVGGPSWSAGRGRHWSRLPVELRDAALAVALVGVELTSLALGASPAWARSGDGVTALAVLAVLAVNLPLTLRRRWPHVALAVSAAAATVVVLAGAPSQLFAPLVALYSVAGQRRRRESFTWLAILLPVGAVALTWNGVPGLVPEHVVLVTAAWSLGERQRARRRCAHDLEQQARRLEDERERAVAIIAAEERNRIAGELDDILAHSVSVMVVQAAAARRGLELHEPVAGEVLEQVAVNGRASLTQLRRLLRLLGEPAAVTYAPQPGLADLDRLAARYAGEGLHVDLQRSGDLRPMPASVDLSAYRIVEESLANVARHAGAASVVVRLEYGDDALDIAVVDHGRGPPCGRADPGHGIPSMRERVALVHGSLWAGALPGGGFQVRARLPREEVG